MLELRQGEQMDTPLRKFPDSVYDLRCALAIACNGQVLPASLPLTMNVPLVRGRDGLSMLLDTAENVSWGGIATAKERPLVRNLLAAVEKRRARP